MPPGIFCWVIWMLEREFHTVKSIFCIETLQVDESKDYYTLLKEFVSDLVLYGDLSMCGIANHNGL